MSLPLPHYLKTSPSLPHSLHFSHSEIQQMGLECNNMFAFCFSGGGQSNGWVGRCRCSFLKKTKQTKTKKKPHKQEGVGGGVVVHSFSRALLWYTVCVLSGPTHKPSFGLEPVSQDTILKHSKSVLLTPIVREKDNRTDTGICTVCPASWMGVSQQCASSSQTLLSPLLADYSSCSPIPFYCFPDLWSVNGCLSHWSCGGSLISWSVRRVERSHWQIPWYNIAACQSLCVYVSVTVQSMWLCANRPFLLWVKYYLTKH